MLHFTCIDETNWRCNLQVSDAQKPYVAAPAVLLARAYAYRNLNSRAFFIDDDETHLGMGLYYDCPELDAYDLSQFFIDAHYQGRGFGRQAVQLVLEEMRRERQYKKVVLCYIEGNEAAKKLYESFGFTETDRDGDEIGMELLL